MVTAQETRLDAETFKQKFSALISGAPSAPIREHRFIDLAASEPPWRQTDLYLNAGDWVTTVAVGKTWLSRELDIWLGPDFQLWMRVGATGKIFRGTRNTHSFVAGDSGPLQLANYFPGEWADQGGGLSTPPENYAAMEGGMCVLVIRWAMANALDGLSSLLACGDIDHLLGVEVDRLRNRVEEPPGWRHLWFLGPSEIYRACNEPGKAQAICCHTHGDVGILKKPVEFPLRPDTRLRWAWKVDALPSDLAEDTLPTHDYVSIAVEFDDGQDLTYFWSAGLPPGSIFRCPLPAWQGRETHMVVRSGRDGLGQWFDEERNVYEDHRIAVGGTTPANIVAIWLIAVSLFQRKEGKCRYADIALHSGDAMLPVC